MAPPSRQTAPIRVLLIEDHRMVAEAIAEALSEHRDIHVVGTAGSIGAGRDIASEQRPDVVLVDYRLPDGTGVEAARELLAAQRGLRVVIVTAAEDEAILAEALDAGCSGCVRKSVGIGALAEEVRSAHAGRVTIPVAALSRIMGELRRPPDAAPFGLTPRELDVLRLLSTGCSTRTMADDLRVTYHTTRNYVQAVLQKLEAHSRIEAVTTALREGLIEPVGALAGDDAQYQTVRTRWYGGSRNPCPRHQRRPSTAAASLGWPWSPSRSARRSTATTVRARISTSGSEPAVSSRRESTVAASSGRYSRTPAALSTCGTL
jgi:DNA-binding NarL/FixJ family response regulator